MMVSPADVASFEAARPRLVQIARRITGDATEAEDVVQDAWIRWQRADRRNVRDAATFLATTTVRLALNVAASARVRHERPGERFTEPAAPAPDPLEGLERRDAVRRGLRMLLERLTPAERAAYLLREAFDERHRRIAQVLAITEAHARQLVRRARRHLADEPRRTVSPAEVQRLLGAFVTAADTGDLTALERALVADVGRGLRPGGVAAAA